MCRNRWIGTVLFVSSGVHFAEGLPLRLRGHQGGHCDPREAAEEHSEGSCLVL